MPGQIPNNIILYRIIHKDNLGFLLSSGGMYIQSHPNADPNYINIGNSTLISQRNNYSVGVNPPGGNLGDYVPFYFGPLSPMLYNIVTGYGVSQIPQADIIYICCDLNLITSNCIDWCFTDGHAKNMITNFYNNLNSLPQVDWNVVFLRFWHNIASDFDRMRRKQAEFLVKNHVPVICISRIIVFDAATYTHVIKILTNLGLQIPVDINPNNQYYY